MNDINDNHKYSVLMSVYHKDNPKWLREAIESMLNQTIKPAEYVIVKDGQLGDEIDEVISEYQKTYNDLFNVVPLAENVGLGLALKTGVENCTYELIARIDADDISSPTRIEKQLSKLVECPELDVIGTLVDEFTDSTDNVIAHVILPETHEEIAKFAKRRCPVRHPTLLYRKSAVLQAGNYRDFLLFEDYELVCRMIMAGRNFYNVQETLHHMRVNDNFYKRRGGVLYLKRVYVMKTTLLNWKFCSIIDFLVSFTSQAVVVLLPGNIRQWIYKKFLRG